METLRKEQLSLYYHLRELLPDNINVVTGYKEEELIIPTVSISGGRLRTIPLELGNREGQKERLWYVDIYATNKQQRDDLGEIVYDSFINNITVYDFEIGFPDPLPPRIGKLIIEPEDRTSEAIMGFFDMKEKLYWRRKITIVARYKED